MSEKKKKKPNKSELLAMIDSWPKLKGSPKIIDHWALDPARRDVLRMLVRAGMDFQKLRIACDNRELSPTETNTAELLPENMRTLLGIGAVSKFLEDRIKNSLKYFLQESEIGCWLLEQKGLGSGWLAGFLLAELPDVYDAGRCNECKVHLLRQVDMTYIHPSPPERTNDDGEDKRNRCIHDGAVMQIGDYYMHEKKPSTFVSFSGLGTEKAWACPECGYPLFWSKDDHCFRHRVYKKLPKGVKLCKYNGTKWSAAGIEITRGGKKQPDMSVIPMHNSVQAGETTVSPKRQSWRPNPYKSILRMKLLGTNGIGDQFIKQSHPYYKLELYDGYRHFLGQKFPNRPDGWLANMAKRKMLYRFLCDLFIKWRETEGLSVRPPYEVEKLGIKHHR